MIDIRTETLLTMPEAAGRIPGRPSLCALWRWRTKGLRGRKLETVLIGGKPYTSVEAIQRFGEQRGGDGSAAANSPGPRSPKQRERSIAQAERELHSAGL